jgi:hypothetical protein
MTIIRIENWLVNLSEVNSIRFVEGGVNSYDGISVWYRNGQRDFIKTDLDTFNSLTRQIMGEK